jgi:hypothetical protein
VDKTTLFIFRRKKKQMGTWRSITLDTGIVYEDFTTFTEVDVGADRIQKTANHIDHASEMNETTYLYKDYGAAHFGDFTHKIKARMVSGDNGVVTYAWMLANDVNNAYWLYTGDKDFIGVNFARSGGSYLVKLYENAGGTLYYDIWNGGSVNTWYYIKMVKLGTSLYAYIYTDADYTTLVDTLHITLQSDYTFRYLYGCTAWDNNTSYGGIMDIENFLIPTKWKPLERASGSGGWKELEFDTLYEDFTTFTEVDIAADRIQKTANHVDHYARRDETTYLYKDYGAAHFGDFTHKIKVKSSGGAQCMGGLWVLANNLGNLYALKSNSYNHIFLFTYGTTLYLREVDSGSDYSDSMSFTASTWYYVKIVKSGTSLNAYVYSDDTYTTLVDTLTLTLQTNHTFRYLYACNTYNNGNVFNCINDIENYDLG